MVTPVTRTAANLAATERARQSACATEGADKLSIGPGDRRRRPCLRKRRLGNTLYVARSTPFPKNPGHTARQSRHTPLLHRFFSTSQQQISMAIHTLPAGWSLLATRPRDELHQALLTSTGERSFEDVPVDWWDASIDAWRPTSIVRLLGGVWDVARDVEVLVPDAGGPSPARISIAHVRLSRLLTAGISRYWVARYQKILVLRLVEQASVLGADPDPLRRLAARLRHQETLAYDVWATAYLTRGSRRSSNTRPRFRRRPMTTAGSLRGMTTRPRSFTRRCESWPPICSGWTRHSRKPAQRPQSALRIRCSPRSRRSCCVRRPRRWSAQRDPILAWPEQHSHGRVVAAFLADSKPEPVAIDLEARA